MMDARVVDSTEEPERWCLGCRYLLRGLESGVCPECGRGFDLGDERTFHQRGTRDAWLRRVMLQNRRTDLMRGVSLGMMLWGAMLLPGAVYVFLAGIVMAGLSFLYRGAVRVHQVVLARGMGIAVKFERRRKALWVAFVVVTLMLSQGWPTVWVLKLHERALRDFCAKTLQFNPPLDAMGFQRFGGEKRVGMFFLSFEGGPDRLFMEARGLGVRGHYHGRRNDDDPTHGSLYLEWGLFEGNQFPLWTSEP